MHASPPDNWPEVAGALLAGGRSLRMGCDKACVEFAGEPLWRRSERVLAGLFSRVFIAGDRPDLASSTLPCYADDRPGSSLGGLATALAHADREWVCVLPCDLPFPSPSLLNALLQARRGARAVVPRTPRGCEPLVACYHHSCLPLVREQLQSGKLRLTALLERLDTRYLEPEHLPDGWRRALRNVNTPAELAALQNVPPAVTVVARSGTGKTTLLEKLIAALTQRGWTIGALKHDTHGFAIDHAGKDSWRLTHAGAAVTAISSAANSALIRRHELEPTVEALLREFIAVDLVLTEGFKRSRLPKIEVHRAALGDDLLCRGTFHDPTLVAVASDVPLTVDVPCFDLNGIEPLADFLEERYLAPAEAAAPPQDLGRSGGLE